MRLRRTTSVIALAVVAAGAAGCSGDEPEEEPGPSIEAPPPAPEPEEVLQECFDEAGLDVEPEAEPAYDAVVEYRVPQDGGEPIVVLLYEDRGAALKAEPDVTDGGATSIELYGVSLLVDTAGETGQPVQQVRDCAGQATPLE